MSNSHPSLSILNLGLIPTEIACLTSKFWSANITSHLHMRRFRFPSGNGKLPLAMVATDRIPKGHFHLLYVAVPFMLLADPCQVHTLPSINISPSHRQPDGTWVQCHPRGCSLGIREEETLTILGSCLDVWDYPTTIWNDGRIPSRLRLNRSTHNQ